MSGGSELRALALERFLRPLPVLSTPRGTTRRTHGRAFVTTSSGRSDHCPSAGESFQQMLGVESVKLDVAL